MKHMMSLIYFCLQTKGDIDYATCVMDLIKKNLDLNIKLSSLATPNFSLPLGEFLRITDTIFSILSPEFAAANLKFYLTQICKNYLNHKLPDLEVLNVLRDLYPESFYHTIPEVLGFMTDPSTNDMLKSDPIISTNQLSIFLIDPGK